MKYSEHLEKVANYLEGKGEDIYNGNHAQTVRIWDGAWDEMKWQGFKPDNANDVRKFIKANK